MASSSQRQKASIDSGLEETRGNLAAIDLDQIKNLTPASFFLKPQEDAAHDSQDNHEGRLDSLHDAR